CLTRFQLSPGWFASQARVAALGDSGVRVLPCRCRAHKGAARSSPRWSLPYLSPVSIARPVRLQGATTASERAEGEVCAKRRLSALHRRQGLPECDVVVPVEKPN